MVTKETGLVAPDPPREGRAEHYPLTQYGSKGKAKDAFLDSYLKAGGYNRVKSAKLAGILLKDVEAWFLEPKFYGDIEARLQATVRDHKDMQTMLVEQAKFIMEGNIADIFDMTENGTLYIQNIKSLPRHISACIRSMDVIRITTTGANGRPEYQEGIRVQMHDKTKVMNIIADLTDIKNRGLKESDSGAPQITGMSLITAAPTVKAKESPNEQEGELFSSGEVLDVEETEGEFS